MELFCNYFESKNDFNLLRRYSIELTLLITGFTLLVALKILIVVTSLKRSLFSFELLFLLPFFTYLMAIVLSKHFNSATSRFLLPLILFFATLFQVIILLTEIALSDDVYRFYLEGKALIHGINPYITSIDMFPPSLFDDYLNKANNPHVTSPYPPFALVLFSILYFISPNPYSYRICFSIGFLASIVVCSKLLPAVNKWKLIIYAWNPLLHLETANGAHFDSLVVLFVMLAIWGVYLERFATAGGFFLLAFLLKYYPLFFVVVFWKHLGKRGLSIFLSGLVLYGIYVSLVPQALLGILTYTEAWYFNASVFWVLVQLIPNFFLAKIVLGGLFILILIRLAIGSDKEAEPSPAIALMVIGLFLLFLPVFHPWYIFAMFPFVVLDKKMNFSWILLTGTLIFSYHVYIAFDTTKIWTESNIMRLIEYFPFYTVLAQENRSSISEWYRYAFKRLRNFNED